MGVGLSTCSLLFAPVSQQGAIQPLTVHPLPTCLQYDSVLDNVSQEATYTATAHEVVESMLAGYNGTIFCYGQVSPS